MGELIVVVVAVLALLHLTYLCWSTQRELVEERRKSARLEVENAELRYWKQAHESVEELRKDPEAWAEELRQRREWGA